MTITYSIIETKTKQEIESGSLHYKTVDGFLDHQLFVDKDTKFKTAWKNGDTIHLYKDGELEETIKLVPSLTLDKWDNYEDNDPKRMEAIDKALEMLKDFDKISVTFDYDGRTRHQLAASTFVDMMKEMGHGEYKFVIGYNYEFTIENK